MPSQPLEESLITPHPRASPPSPPGSALCCCGVAATMDSVWDAPHGASVHVESGRRLGMKYDLFEPCEPSDRNGATLVLVHGFGCNRTYVSGHARRLASAGATVLTPNVYFMPALREESRACQESIQKGIDQVADHASWLLKRVTSLDRRRCNRPGSQSSEDDAPAEPSPSLFLAGHSAGGAVVFEAAITLASWGVCLRGVLLMDGVPWPRTVRAASLFPSHQTSLVAVRSAPSAWNKNGAISEVLAGVHGPPPLVVLLPHSQHGDAFLPRPRWAAWAFRAAGLLGPELCTRLYSDLLCEFISCQADTKDMRARVVQLAEAHPGEVELVSVGQAAPLVSHPVAESSTVMA